MKNIILASASPRRKALLERKGIEFDTCPCPIPEKKIEGELPKEMCMRLAGEKAVYASNKFPSSFVIGADTIVCLDNEVFGKPKDRENAHKMLSDLSGKMHDVITGVCIIIPGKGRINFTETTHVYFKNLSSAEIEDYINTKEPYDKAGAYAIQGEANKFIERIEGDYDNVVGLPVERVASYLEYN